MENAPAIAPQPDGTVRCFCNTADFVFCAELRRIQFGGKMLVREGSIGPFFIQIEHIQPLLAPHPQVSFLVNTGADAAGNRFPGCLRIRARLKIVLEDALVGAYPKEVIAAVIFQQAHEVRQGAIRRQMRQHLVRLTPPHHIYTAAPGTCIQGIVRPHTKRAHTVVRKSAMFPCKGGKTFLTGLQNTQAAFYQPHPKPPGRLLQKGIHHPRGQTGIPAQIGKTELLGTHHLPAVVFRSHQKAVGKRPKTINNVFSKMEEVVCELVINIQAMQGGRQHLAIRHPGQCGNKVLGKRTGIRGTV